MLYMHTHILRACVYASVCVCVCALSTIEKYIINIYEKVVT